jgi:Lrp/AsnC family transcriptional regulator
MAALDDVKVDRLDVAILQELQKDASRSISEIGEAVGLSTNPCWRRIKRLEEAGVITHRVAILAGEKLGLGVTVFVMVKTNQHTEGWLRQFARGVEAIEEVVEFHRMTGDIDYLLKVVVSDIADYDRVYRMIIKAAPLSDVSSTFSMEKIKGSVGVPLEKLRRSLND